MGNPANSLIMLENMNIEGSHENVIKKQTKMDQSLAKLFGINIPINFPKPHMVGPCQAYRKLRVPVESKPVKTLKPINPPINVLGKEKEIYIGPNIIPLHYMVGTFTFFIAGVVIADHYF